MWGEPADDLPAFSSDRSRGLDEPPSSSSRFGSDVDVVMGNWGPELVALAGGTCALGVAGEHSTTLP